MITEYHSKYYANDITRLAPSGSGDQLSMALFDAAVDLNPHQIEAAMFALQSPIAEGVILADEVGLGKTIEAAIVLCQKWAERRRRLLIICPASIRQQWANELREKFSLPAMVLDAKSHKQLKQDGQPWPLEQPAVLIMSFHYAAKLQDELRPIPWDLVVIDEAHKLRNAYRPSNRIGQALRWALEGKKKVLLTATPLQNSLMELYGLSTFIDENLFGDPSAFRSRYINGGGDIGELRYRLADFCKRTLRRQVLEYVRYTARKTITQPFRPTDAEQQLYDAISQFLQDEESYAIPSRQRHLTVLILRKLLASSSHAIAGTLETMKARLVDLRDGIEPDEDWTEEIIESEEIEEELLDEWLADEEDDELRELTEPAKLRSEIENIAGLAEQARSIVTDTKTRALMKALDVGFAEQQRMGAANKALIFTESRRTQRYLHQYLEDNGYAGKVVSFSGTNSGDEVNRIYEQWLQVNDGTGRVTESKQIDVRSALIDHFRDHAQIMIATEAAAEGVNLQFCSMVINYDLPWNPQRIEQRIGRCHRYGQTHDVIVINFLNERNEADQRVHTLLSEKFNLFNGVFGASDEVLGSLESGVDFEKRILKIYQDCRTPDEINAAFDALQQELDEQIRSRMDETRQALLEHFDEDVHARLKLRLADTRAQLDRVGQRFWDVTQFMLRDRARFDEQALAFDLSDPPTRDIAKGRYHLISRNNDGQANDHGNFLYRLSHPLGEHVLDNAKGLYTPLAELRFDITNHPTRSVIVEGLANRSGWLTLQRLTVTSYETEEYLLFSGMDDAGASLDQETCEKLFGIAATVRQLEILPGDIASRIEAGARQAEKAALNRSLETNNAHFASAREKLERWAEDKVLAAEKALKDTKEQIKALRREARQAATLEDEHAVQTRLQELERKQRRQRQQIFDVEDEIAEKRDSLIDALQKRMQRGQEVETLFTIRWSVV
ncbi:SNF2-related protein [Alteriqipengyuania sp. WL0013]|uniref:SNF2-related protein n=1 Tax=Alteriqipengyuania sp. WL0013 TaxID=3110773 RepID=UPI002CD456E4|nr:SNF2-related protein [Alteriqipengyuania sp. WL0013]MEB3415005.1 SNF2-related protein [Alteriqipengyuania sp. WL0013]